MMTVVFALIFANTIGPEIHDAVTVKTWVPLGTPLTTKEHPVALVMHAEPGVPACDKLGTATSWFNPYGLVT